MKGIVDIVVSFLLQAQNSALRNRKHFLKNFMPTVRDGVFDEKFF
jgi:hypothetical protein